MDILKTQYHIRSLDEQLLLPPNVELSEEVLNELVERGRAASFQSASLLEYGTIKQDVLEFLNHDPYKIVFSDQNQTKEIIEIISKVNLNLSIWESLDYFKSYDFQTYRHNIMVFILSVFFAKIMLSDHKELIGNTITGSAHDLGKTCIPLDILKKTTPLTKKEHNILQHHTIAGYVLLSYYLEDHRSIIAKLARDHHERKNGSGYPRGILQNDIMVEIVAVADTYDALLMPRSYRPVSFDNRTALEELTSMAEQNKIGWDVIKALIAQNRKHKPYYKEVIISKEKRGTEPKGNLYGKIIDD